MTNLRYLLWVFLLAITQAAFIETTSCYTSTDPFVFALPLIDVAMDEKNQLLKFLINTEVRGHGNKNEIIVSDVNTTTNLYTTLHIEVSYGGNVIVDENRRLCDLLMVKKSSEFYDSPRFAKHASSSLKPHSFPTGLIHNGIGGSLVSRRELLKRGDLTPLLSATNSTIERLFSNSTGEIVQCPLYDSDSIALYYQVDVSECASKIGSYQVRFTVVSNDNKGTALGCFRLNVTPVLSQTLINTIIGAIFALFVVTGIINFLTVIYSSYQESSNPFLFMASTICNQGLLLQLGATVQVIIVYLQFAFFIGGLDLDYPGFYQPLIGSIRWSALLGFNFIGDTPSEINPDRVYFTFNQGGIKTLASFTSVHHSGTVWPNFMITLGFWLVIVVLAQQAFLVINYCTEWLRTSSRYFERVIPWKRFMSFNDFDTKRDLAFILGQLTSHFMLLFGFPFLVITSFTLYLAANLNGRHKYIFDPHVVRNLAYSPTSSYEELFEPLLALTSEENKCARSNLAEVSKRSIEYSNARSYAHVSVSTIVLSSIFLGLWIAIALYLIFGYMVKISNWKIQLNDRIRKLYTSVKTILIWSPFYHLYHPNRVYFVIINVSSLLIRLLIIGCLQKSGAYQVGALIILEVAYLILHFGIWPFFVKFSLWSTTTIIPPARLLVTFLCIPFIKGLNYGEQMKTRIAFTHFCVHLFVALAFIVQLAYCVVITILSVRKSDRQFTTSSELKKQPSYDSFSAAFLYQHVVRKEANPIHKVETQASSDEESAFEQLYYRSGTVFEARPDDNESLQQVGKVQSNSSLGQTASVTMGSDSPDSPTITPSPKNDYTFREADLIYRKYFTDDLVDPDIKALWESRKLWDIQGHGKEIEESPAMPAALQKSTKLLGLFGKKQPIERSFQVSRPRQLIVKTTEPDEKLLLTSNSTSSK